MYLRNGAWPPGNVTIFLNVVTASGRYVKQIGSGSSRYSNTGPDKWEEAVGILTPDLDVHSITVQMGRLEGAGSGDIWADDVYFGEGVGFEQPPAAKRAFNGANVRVDPLGNFEVLRSSGCHLFFPLCIFADQNRADWSIYSKQGFNCDMWGGQAANLVQRAKNAVSSFNPDGMMSGFQIAQYISLYGWVYNNPADLANTINGLKSSSLINNILMYYWDNEEAWRGWDVPKTITDTVKRVDVNASGQRMHPIYVLQGDMGMARTYRDASSRTFADVVGTYTPGSNTAGPGGNANGLTILNNVEGQDTPVVFAQVNLPQGYSFRTTIYSAIAHGARGVGVYRDGAPGPEFPQAKPVEQLEWWPDLPNIRREIDQMMPLIREPHWTSWRITSSASVIDFGTRDHNGEGYVIVANPSGQAVTTTFTIANLPYTPVSANNFFTNAPVASVSNAAFTVMIPAYQTAVYRLAK